MNRCILGNCLEVLPTLEAGSVQTCVTSPPYWGLRDYGKRGQFGLEPTPEAYVARMVEVFREVKRVLRDDGTLWLNLGDSYCSAPNTHGENNWRNITLASKGREGRVPRPHQSFRRDKKPVGGNPHRVVPALKPKDLVGIPWRVAFALQADGWYLRQDIIWHKPNPMPESVRDRCTKSHEYIFLLSKSAKYYYDAEAISEPVGAAFANDSRHVTGSTDRNDKQGYDAAGAQNPKGPHRLFGKSGNKERKPGSARGCPEGSGSNVCGSVPWEGSRRNKRSVWTVTAKPFSGAHFATFPSDLIEPCILAGSKPGDVVLDPFGGSGTTGQVAEALGRQWVLIELNPAYKKLSRDRTAQQGMVLA